METYCFKSLRSSLQSHSLWVTLYIVNFGLKLILCCVTVGRLFNDYFLKTKSPKKKLSFNLLIIEFRVSHETGQSGTYTRKFSSVMFCESPVAYQAQKNGVLSMDDVLDRFSGLYYIRRTKVLLNGNAVGPKLHYRFCFKIFDWRFRDFDIKRFRDKCLPANRYISEPLSFCFRVQHSNF